MTPEMNRERAINLLNEFGLPLDEERITMIGDFLVIWIGWELRHVQQPATEPGLKCNHCDHTYYGVIGPCPKCGKNTAQKLVALALRDVPQGPDEREIVAEWRSCLCAAWASGHRAVMTMLLERGPSYPVRSVPVGPEGKK